MASSALGIDSATDGNRRLKPATTRAGGTGCVRESDQRANMAVRADEVRSTTSATGRRRPDILHKIDRFGTRFAPDRTLSM
jgi:hypothetical protein